MKAPGHEPMGEVFTRRWVVDWMLDLAGYTPDRPLHRLTLLEPSCGAGAFLLPALDRLLSACTAHDTDILDATDAVVAVDLHPPSVETARKAVIKRLADAGLATSDATRLAATWVQPADFLLDELPSADLVIGNPPYVRLEDVPQHLAVEYRRRWATMGGRADLYVGFYERGLDLLNDGGVLAFICADRWMRNSYGRGLRGLITDGPWAVDTIARLHDVDCFEVDVAAYPAITVLRRGSQKDGTVVDTDRTFDAEHVPAAMAALDGKTVDGPSRSRRWTGGSALTCGPKPARPSWHSSPTTNIASNHSRTRRQTRVGIGVASGADDVFITSDKDLVEPDRTLPLVLARHIAGGQLNWDPTYLVTPWNGSGPVGPGRARRAAALRPG